MPIKTALMHAIEQVKSERRKQEPWMPNEHNHCIDDVIEILEGLLETERQQINDAYADGLEDADNVQRAIITFDYYNNTYKQS